ncbi:hypothetical protein SARI_02861 [Salmonella enterica subsp. arizonae serovar 62:z4,z23:-]|uniref:Uncharacterized protein n=1 Tax=Salmonella arizonae (strain ATCC BAA-731 / CDC346-86 / RSK2980) TaxID=41514 RepID=A9MQB0_SALAR|nr:hypothetical protein SARI_02861 [Salmonella enterica subsp. arizonae serovar 62:z4,z23:-]
MCCHQVDAGIIAEWRYAYSAWVLNTDKKAQATALFLWIQQDEKTANCGWDYPQPER